MAALQISRRTRIRGSASMAEHNSRKGPSGGQGRENDTRPAASTRSSMTRTNLPSAPCSSYSAGRLEKWRMRSEEHTSELQSRENLVCRLLLEKKKRRERRSNTGAR